MPYEIYLSLARGLLRAKPSVAALLVAVVWVQPPEAMLPCASCCTLQQLGIQLCTNQKLPEDRDRSLFPAEARLEVNRQVYSSAAPRSYLKIITDHFLCLLEARPVDATGNDHSQYQAAASQALNTHLTDIQQQTETLCDSPLTPPLIGV